MPPFRMAHIPILTLLLPLTCPSAGAEPLLMTSDEEKLLHVPSISIERPSAAAAIKLEIDLDELEIDPARSPASLSRTLGSEQPPQNMEFTLSGGEFSFMFDDLVYYAEHKNPFQMEQKEIFPRLGHLRTFHHSDHVSFDENPFVFLK